MKSDRYLRTVFFIEHILWLLLMVFIVLQIETVFIKWEQDPKNQRWPDGTYINNDYI